MAVVDAAARRSLPSPPPPRDRESDRRFATILRAWSTRGLPLLPLLLLVPVIACIQIKLNATDATQCSSTQLNSCWFILPCCRCRTRGEDTDTIESIATDQLGPNSNRIEFNSNHFSTSPKLSLAGRLVSPCFAFLVGNSNGRSVRRRPASASLHCRSIFGPAKHEAGRRRKSMHSAAVEFCADSR